MAQRIGKYKISKRESEVSVRDGGTVAGALTIDSGLTVVAGGVTATAGGLTVTAGDINLKGGQTVLFQDFAVASGSATGDNAFTGNAGTLTEAAHAGKTILLPDADANATLRIPTPSKAGVTYKLVYNGIADDAHDMVISFADDACYFKGSLLTIDEDLATAASVSTIFANGTSNDVLTINDPHTYCIDMVSLSTTVMAVWGYVVSDTVAAFSDAD